MSKSSETQPVGPGVDVPRKSSFSFRSILHRPRKLVTSTCDDEELAKRKKFVLKLAKALLAFGAPSHRIESQLAAAAEILGVTAGVLGSSEFVHLPNIVIVSMRCLESNSTRTHFVRATGRVALTSLHQVHQIYRDVLHDGMQVEVATDALRKLLRSSPIYPLYQRCILAFICASIICVLSFGGSILDMWVSGACAGVLQYLGLNAASKSSTYANVYEISVSIIVAFVARGLSSIRGSLFCYNAIASAGVVLILPGFTILISALELMSKNIFCGSVRLVYAIIYTLFLGFGLTIGSDFYFLVDRRARRLYYHSAVNNELTYTHGHFSLSSASGAMVTIRGIVGQTFVSSAVDSKLIKGCYRDPSWSWLKRPLPTWTVFFLVPLYSLCSSLANLQNWKSVQLPVMVFFSCAAFAANRAASLVLPGRTDLVSAVGAFAIGCLGNIYSRLIRGTAFTSMVTGVLFLVPSGIAQGGGVSQTYQTSAERYSNGFALAMRMISVAAGVTVGLFVSQVAVYAFGTRKHGALFAF